MHACETWDPNWVRICNFDDYYSKNVLVRNPGESARLSRQTRKLTSNFTKKTCHPSVTRPKDNNTRHLKPLVSKRMRPDSASCKLSTPLSSPFQYCADTQHTVRNGCACPPYETLPTRYETRPTHNQPAHGPPARRAARVQTVSMQTA